MVGVSRIDHADIRIGTLAPFVSGPEYVRGMAKHGFETFGLTGWDGLPDDLDLIAIAPAYRDAAGEAVISCLEPFGNPLQNPQHRDSIERAIRAARAFGTDLVTGFTGALEDRSIPDNIAKFKEVWTELAKVADGEGVRLAFENCAMGGNWHRPKYNLATTESAWELLLDAVPFDNVGLEWEPCHQLNHLVPDPIPGLKRWLPKIFHLHGKDATMDREVLAKDGTHGPGEICYHRHPGFGESNWSLIIDILRMANWQGAIDIEGFHDPVYKGDLETTGQVFALNHLKACRGGPFHPNP